MLLKTADGAFHVIFHYDEIIGQRNAFGKPMKPDLRRTICELFITDTQTSWMGATICRPPDQFKKATGRKLAMLYALKAAFPGTGGSKDKEIRQRIWKAYFEKVSDLKASRRRPS